jgi:hypothetical protein
MNNYKVLSRVCLAAGGVSVAVTLAVWLTGRAAKNDARMHDGLFMGLWAPSLFVLADRFEVMALEEEERKLAKPLEDLEAESRLIAELEEPMRVQSPHPLSYVKR